MRWDMYSLPEEDIELSINLAHSVTEMWALWDIRSLLLGA
jgi:hypothetical protein